MVEISEVNTVKMVGSFEDHFTFDSYDESERIFVSNFLVIRLSGRVDRIPVFIAESLLDLISQDGNEVFKEKKYLIRGFVYSKTLNGKLKIGVKVQEIEVKEDYEYDLNFVTLSGIICKEPRLCNVSKDRMICDFMLCCKNKGVKSYIPIVGWDDLARRLSIYKLGDKLLLRARIQSRIFYKKLSDGSFEQREVYEIVANKLKKVNRQ
ncbi:MAG: single-stranded DNA-binding protein [Clostridia bacterium]|nr:single-stranded DNA-binding protein [Clostridia bacterium]